MKRIDRFCVIIYWMMILCADISAQDFSFKHIGASDGLSCNHVTSILKDSKGFVWIGTVSGLNRYDGYGMRIYPDGLDGEDPLPGSYIIDIQEDGDKRLWIRTEKGYTLYDAATDRFEHDMGERMKQWGVDGMPSLLYVDYEYTLWMVVAGKGVYRLKRGEQRACCMEEGEMPAYSGNVAGVARCDDGLLLVRKDGALLCLNPDTMALKWVNEEIASQNFPEWKQGFGLFVDNDRGQVWIYGVAGVWIYSISNQTWEFQARLSDRNNMVTDITQDKQGNIWIARDKTGIEVLAPSGKVLCLTNDPTNTYTLSDNTITTLYTDPAGIVWVGTYKKGVSYYHESMFKFRWANVGDVNRIVDNGDGTLWIGTDDEGVLHWDRQTGGQQWFRHTPNANSLSSNVVTSLLKDSRGHLWIGTYWNGLNCYKDGHFTHYRAYQGNNSLQTDNIWTLAEDSDGNIWIGHWGGGLQCLNPQTGQFTTYTTAVTSELGANHISSLCVTRDNRLLIGTLNGFSIMDLKSRQISRFRGATNGISTLTSQSVNQVYEDSRGLIWIATSSGLNVYNPRRDELQEVPLHAGLARQMIQSIAEDNERSMWVTTSSRLANVVPTIDGKTGEISFRCYLYGSKDGLQDCDFNQRSMVCLPSGEIMVGGVYGVNYFYPGELQYNRILPRVMFTDFQLFNKSVEVGKTYDGVAILPSSLNEADKVELNHRQNVFTVFFASDNYVLPEKTCYAYCLKGFNSQWMETAAGVHNVTYTNLAPGSYTLCVKAINSDGYEGTEEAQLHIVILPPFWKTAWAYTLYVLLVLGCIAMGIYLISRKERNKFHRRQQEENRRKQEELNQLKFRFFTNVSHELRTPLTLILSPLEGMINEMQDGRMKGKLVLMQRNALRLLNLVNQLLDFRKNEMAVSRLSLSRGDIVAYVRSICNSFLMFSEKNNINLTFYSAAKELHMMFDEDKIGKVVMNLLSNAFKFTPGGGRVDVALELPEEKPDHLQIRVSDTGIGIAKQEKTRIFERFYQVAQEGTRQIATGSGIGLSMVRDFVTLHGGTVDVVDNAGGKGSVFIVEIPIRTEREVQTAGEQPVGVVEQPEMEQRDIESQPDKQGLQKPCALLVDDNEDLLTFMRDSLGLHFRILTATNGREAWKLLENELPDIIVCDIMMPETDGNELCRMVKGEKRLSGIPVILLTAKHSVDDKLEGLTLGADDYMTKPFNVEILTLRMQKLVSLSKEKQTTSAHLTLEPHQIAITSLDEKLIENAIAYIEKNMGRPELSVEDMGRELGMSRASLYKRMLQITGKSPSEFIRIIRLKRAAQLLRESQLNVSEIAYQVGFNNPKYFSRYFREEFGMLPSDYQESASVGDKATHVSY